MVKLNGLKLWPMIVSLVFTLAFHRGRPSGWCVRDGLGMRFPVGVVESCRDDGDGEGDARPEGVPKVE